MNFCRWLIWVQENRLVQIWAVSRPVNHHIAFYKTFREIKIYAKESLIFFQRFLAASWQKQTSGPGFAGLRWKLLWPHPFINLIPWNLSCSSLDFCRMRNYFRCWASFYWSSNFTSYIFYRRHISFFKTLPSRWRRRYGWLLLI